MWCTLSRPELSVFQLELIVFSPDLGFSQAPGRCLGLFLSHLPDRKLPIIHVSSFSITPGTTGAGNFRALSAHSVIQVQSVTYPTHVPVRSALLSPLHR